MKTKLTLLVLLTLIALAPFSKAQQDTRAKKEEIENIVKGLKYKQGEIDIENGLAKLNVPPEFNYLDASDAETVLVKVWQNPPSASKVLGMLMPAGKTPLDPGTWAVTISYMNDGYVKDDDAGKINYADELKKMQSAVHEHNKARIDNGYKPIELIGWATPPHYDAASHKLYWAKELKFGDEGYNTLNYDIRILGRRGVLVLSAIASMDQLPEIEQNNPKILSMVNFNDGNRYADFDPKIDKVATYGLAALVVGGIAAKLGLFKGLLLLLKPLWIALLAAKKLVVIGIAVIGSWLRKLFGKRKQA